VRELVLIFTFNLFIELILKFLPYKLSTYKKPLFIYLPGMDGSGKLLQNQRHLRDFFEVRCFSFSQERATSWEIFVTKIVEFLEGELQVYSHKQIYLCGESFGACIALKLIEQIPRLFDKVILINSASSFYRRNWLNVGSYVTRFMPDFVYYGSALVLFPFLANIDAIAPRERAALLKALQSLSPSTVSNRISLLNKFILNVEKVKAFSSQVLIVASQKDNLLPSVDEAYRLKHIFPNSRVSILPHSGHCCLLEKKVNLVKIMQQSLFLN